jgi:hypothetical protein
MRKFTCATEMQSGKGFQGPNARILTSYSFGQNVQQQNVMNNNFNYFPQLLHSLH